MYGRRKCIESVECFEHMEQRLDFESIVVEAIPEEVDGLEQEPREPVEVAAAHVFVLCVSIRSAKGARKVGTVGVDEHDQQVSDTDQFAIVNAKLLVRVAGLACCVQVRLHAGPHSLGVTQVLLPLLLGQRKDIIQQDFLCQRAVLGAMCAQMRCYTAAL